MNTGLVKLPRSLLLKASTLLVALTVAWNATADDIPLPTELPQGADVITGSATINYNANNLEINQTSSSLTTNWNSFNVGESARVTFNQPSSEAIAINRVIGSDASKIFGSLEANGRVYVVNPNGIIFGENASVNVGALVATTLNMLDENNFEGTSEAQVINKGNINAGLVALLGKDVINEGIVVANMGNVVLASGEKISLNFDGKGLINIIIDKESLNGLVQNNKAIIADGGKVIMSAKTKGELVGQVVYNTGTVQANSIVSRDGEIYIDSYDEGMNYNEGTIQAEEGSVTLKGNRIYNIGTVDVSGEHAGEINLEGNIIMQQGELHANSSVGDGGNINVAIGRNYIESSYGKIHAKGAKKGGTVNVESSGNDETKYFSAGQVNVVGEEESGVASITADIMEMHAAEIVTEVNNKNNEVNVKDEDVKVAANSTKYFSSGEVNVEGEEEGGVASITADIMEMHAAKVIADGGQKGGEVKIGGDFQGEGEGKKAKEVNINHYTEISANAKQANDGGKVVVWSEDTTKFAGKISANAGESGGNGGKVEVSSKNDLYYAGEVSAFSKDGEKGELLLDPKNITISTSVGFPYFELVDPNSASGNSFGSALLYLANGNIAVGSPGDDTGASNAGAVHLYNGTSGALISTFNGARASDAVGTNLTALTGNNNFVAQSNTVSNASYASIGGVTWVDGSAGKTGTISTANSYMGARANDNIGSGGIYPLVNGNYVISSPAIYNVSSTVSNAGAATWCNGAGGATTYGTVSSSNSIVGGKTNGQVSSGGIYALSNGNYVIVSPDWINPGDVVSVGAVTWATGTAQSALFISTSNSQVGSSTNDRVGSGGVVELSNGNYVIVSPNWDNGGTANVGAVTWVNGTNGQNTQGNSNAIVSSSNSMVGSTANDQVGSGGAIALSNGHYAVASPLWDWVAFSKIDSGLVTWGNGSTGATVGAISSSNSLYGSENGDNAGSGGLVALNNGYFVAISPNWSFGGVTTSNQAGAVTLVDGTTSGTWGRATSIFSAGSQYGHAGDQIGSGGVTVLTNNNYVISSPNYDGGKGAVTWVNGTNGWNGGGVSNEYITSANSLIGTDAGHNVGSGSTGGGVTNNGVVALSNGNYVVVSPNWDNGATTNVGAVTWCNGTTGRTGNVSTANSLYGTTANDQIGSYQVKALTNGNYVVSSPNWDNGVTADVGAVTWGNGSTGTTGAVSTANSLYGATASDQVGAGETYSLNNGNYIIRSNFWRNGGVGVGAITLLDGTVATSNTVTTSNSIYGSTASDISNSTYAFNELPSGNVIMRIPNYDNGASNTGGFTFIPKDLRSFVAGPISAANSLFATTASAGASSLIKASTTEDKFAISFPSDVNGKVYIATTDPNLLTYSYLPSQSLSINPNFISGVLSTGTNVILQANNDITVNNAITANNTSGNGGALTMQAGRSVLINANITTDNGNLTVVANDLLSNGVVDAQRDVGNAEITMASGTTINTGTGNLQMFIRSGLGKTNLGSGNITLDTINAQHILIRNDGSTNGGNILRNTGAPTITATSLALDVSNASNTTGTIGNTTNYLRPVVTNLDIRTRNGNAWISSPQGFNIGGSSLGSLNGINVGSGSVYLHADNSITNTEDIYVGNVAYFETHNNNGNINISTGITDNYIGGDIYAYVHGSGSINFNNFISNLNFAGATAASNTFSARTSGNITDSGALTIGGNASFTSTGSNNTITLDNPNTYGGTISLNTTGASGNASVSNTSSALNFAASTIGGNLSATTSGNILDSGVLTVTGTSNFTTTGGATTINLDSASTYTGAVNLNTTGGAASITNVASALNLGTSTVSGALTTSSVGSLTDSGVVLVAGNASFTTTGANNTITLDNANIYTGTISLNTSGASGNASVSNTVSNLDFAASTVGGNLSATTSGYIYDSGVLTVTGTSNFTTTGGVATISLDSASTYTGAVSLNTTGGAASVTNVASALNLGASTVNGALTTSSVGSLTDSGAVSTTGNASFTTTGTNSTITLDNANTYGGTISLNTTGASGNASVSNTSSALNFAASTVGGNLSATTSNNILDSGVLTVTGTSNFTTTGAARTIVLDSASTYTGAVSLNTNSGAASITNVASALNLGASTVNGTLTTSSVGSLTDSGNVSATGNASFTTTGSNNTITLDNANTYGGTISLNTTGATGNASVSNTASILNFATSNIGGTLTASTSNDIIDTGVLTIGSNASFTSTGTNNDITLDSANTYGGTISLNTTGASGNASVSNTSSALNFTASTVGGNLSATTSGNILDSGVLTVTGTSNFTTTGASTTINMDSASTYTGSVTLNTVGGAASVTNVASNLDLAASTVGAALTTSAIGNITDSGVLAITGNSSFTSTGANNDITLNSANIYGGTIALNTTGATGNASVTNTASDINFAASTIGGNLTISTTGNILDSGILNVGGTSNFTTAAASRTITLDSASTYTGTVTLTTLSNATITNVVSNLDLAAPSIGGSLTVSAVGNITDSGSIVVSNDSSFTSTGTNNDITLDNINSLVGAISLNTTGASGNASITNAVSFLNFGNSTIGGNLTVSTAWGILDSGILNVGGTSNFTTTGSANNINLDSASTYTGAVSLNTVDDYASITNVASNLDLGASTVGAALTVSAVGNITDSGVLAITGDASFTSTGTNNDITLDNANSYGGTISLNTTGATGNASVTNTASVIDFATSNVGGNLVANTSNDIVDSGIITVGGNTVLISTGTNNDITLNSANNFNGTIAVNTMGATGNVSITNSASNINFGNSVIGGALSISTANNILDTGFINVGGTTSLTTTAASKNIMLDSASTYTGNITVSSVSGDVAIVNAASDVNLNAATITGNLSLSSSQNVYDAGTLNISGNAAFASIGTGNVVMDDPNVYGGTLWLSTANGNASVTNTSSNMDISGANINGNLTVTTNGTISDSGAVTVTGTTLYETLAGNNSINLDSVSTYTGAITMRANGTGNVTLKNVVGDMLLDFARGLNVEIENDNGMINVVTNSNNIDAPSGTVTLSSRFGDIATVPNPMYVNSYLINASVFAPVDISSPINIVAPFGAVINKYIDGTNINPIHHKTNGLVDILIVSGIGSTLANTSALFDFMSKKLDGNYLLQDAIKSPVASTLLEEKKVYLPANSESYFYFLDKSKVATANNFLITVPNKIFADYSYFLTKDKINNLYIKTLSE